MHASDALCAEKLELFAQRREARRRRLRREEFAGMRLEGEHARDERARRRRPAQTIENGLVTFVHAVEIADGQRDRRQCCSARTTSDQHGGDATKTQRTEL